MDGANHITSDRAWALITTNGEFTPTEAAHVQVCENCQDFIYIFIQQAKIAGFAVSLKLPEEG